MCAPFKIVFESRMLVVDGAEAQVWEPPTQLRTDPMPSSIYWTVQPPLGEPRMTAQPPDGDFMISQPPDGDFMTVQPPDGDFWTRQPPLGLLWTVQPPDGDLVMLSVC